MYGFRIGEKEDKEIKRGPAEIQKIGERKAKQKSMFNSTGGKI